jgi:uncharacterized protein DUF4406
VRLYTAGPMTHIPQFNFPAFDKMAAALRAAGHEVISPAELDDPVDRAAALASPDGSALSYGTGVKQTWGWFLARDVRLLADDGIEGIVVLPGWETSRGARLETFVGNALCGMPVFTFERGYLRPLPYLALVRAWAAKPDLSFYTPYVDEDPYAFADMIARYEEAR